ncbi:MAG: hypothetical protein GTN89_10225 [Acidobacteria bacterium]|nr:hypothetical protein [Acidobacteriota bacterium]NIQ30728.1 hypothetical protein [Acidobacteriota bacterium]NIQ85724.1 hypothetical protein [Acidobacteriota bacterium]
MTDETALNVLTTRIRYRKGRSEFRLGLPYLHLDGAASLVGGTPTGEPSGMPGPPAANPSTSESGPGDVSLRFDYDIIQGSSKRPWVTTLLRFKLPTADEDKGLGSGEADVEGGLLFTQPVGRFSLLLEGRLTKLGDPDGVDYKDVRLASAGLAKQLGTRTQVYGFWEYRSHPIDGREARQSTAIGASRRFGTQGRVRWSAALYVGLTETSEDWGVQTNLSREF